MRSALNNIASIYSMYLDGKKNINKITYKQIKILVNYDVFVL